MDNLTEVNLEMLKLVQIQLGLMVNLIMVFSEEDIGIMVFSKKDSLLVQVQVQLNYRIFQILYRNSPINSMDFGMMGLYKRLRQ